MVTDSGQIVVREQWHIRKVVAFSDFTFLLQTLCNPLYPIKATAVLPAHGFWASAVYAQCSTMATVWERNSR